MTTTTTPKPLDRPAEHEFEAAHGLPEVLPANERLLWQGAPDAWAIARDALHLRGIGAYFGVLLAWRGLTVFNNGGSAVDAAVAVAWVLPLALAGLALLGLLGWLIARTSVYTVTDRRVVMRIGIVLSITFNLPYRQIQSAGLKTRRDGSGDLTLLLGGEDRIAYLHLWPHAKPWEVRRSQPMLRGVPNASGVAAVLAVALQASLEQRPAAAEPAPAGTISGAGRPVVATATPAVARYGARAELPEEFGDKALPHPRPLFRPAATTASARPAEAQAQGPAPARAPDRAQPLAA